MTTLTIMSLLQPAIANKSLNVTEIKWLKILITTIILNPGQVTKAGQMARQSRVRVRLAIKTGVALLIRLDFPVKIPWWSVWFTTNVAIISVDYF